MSEVAKTAKQTVEKVDKLSDVDIHLTQQVAEVGKDIAQTGEDVLGVADIAASAAVNCAQEVGDRFIRRPELYST